METFSRIRACAKEMLEAKKADDTKNFQEQNDRLMSLFVDVRGINKRVQLLYKARRDDLKKEEEDNALIKKQVQELGMYVNNLKITLKKETDK